MFKTISKPNQVSEPSSPTRNNAKTIILEKSNHVQNVKLLSNNFIVKFCKENIMHKMMLIAKVCTFISL